MNRIFKYQIPCMEKFTVSLPDGARIIRVDGVDGKFWLWAIVDDEAPRLIGASSATRPGSRS